MVSPLTLIEMLSRVTGVPLATVTDIDRRLVKAGLRTKTGRGPHVARMTPVDAARLLTAILGSAQANIAAEAVGRYERTQVDSERSSRGLFKRAGLRDLAHLTDRHGFVEGLTALIASAASGSLAELRLHPDEGRHPRIELSALTRATAATLRLTGLPSRMTASITYVPVPVGDAQAGGDLEQSRRVTERTVYAVAELFREDQDHD